MKNEKVILDTSNDKELEVINTDELIPDFSFQFKIRKMDPLFNLNDDNYGFCLEG